MPGGRPPIPFWDRVEKTDTCWLWTGPPSRLGYGMRRHEGRYRGAHVVGWLLQGGEEPGDLHVLHHCDTPLCVRKEHLYLGTPKDNAEDRVRRDRGQRKGGRCVNGHVVAVVGVTKNRGACRQCARDAYARWYSRQKVGV